MENKQRFSQSAIEGLGYYVYYLEDPRDRKVFYVGKGTGDRVFSHATDALENYEDSDKMNTIRDIIQAGYEVSHVVLRHGMTEDEAFEVESALIDFIGKDQLTNRVLGHGSFDRGIMTTTEIEQLYSADDADIDAPVILININRLYERQIGAQELYEATRASWKVGVRRENARYALGVFRGVIRGVYEIHDWEPAIVENGKTVRWKFNGVSAESVWDKYGNKRVTKYIRKGAQNPIRYVNC